MRRGTISTDGASKGNPGPAGIGVVIRDDSGNIIREISENIGQATNNFAEYAALIRGLAEALEMGFTHLTVTTDSELMARQVNGRYQVRNPGIIPLFEAVLDLKRKFKSVSVEHVTRDKNKEADKLASEAASPKPPKEPKQPKAEKPKPEPQQPQLLLEGPPPQPVKPEAKKMIQRLSVRTSSRAQFVDITSQVQDAVKSSGVSDGICTVFVPHTTAGITINENADPDVTRDIIDILNKLVPESAHYRHAEGNSDSHVKASMMGFSADVLVEHGRLVLGTWQAIYFCEFDGPRDRQVYVRVG
jgi:secondary thiamine-phosphate synthase enzyme